MGSVYLEIHRHTKNTASLYTVKHVPENPSIPVLEPAPRNILWRAWIQIYLKSLAMKKGSIIPCLQYQLQPPSNTYCSDFSTVQSQLPAATAGLVRNCLRDTDDKRSQTADICNDIKMIYSPQRYSSLRNPIAWIDIAGASPKL